MKYEQLDISLWDRCTIMTKVTTIEVLLLFWNKWNQIVDAIFWCCCTICSKKNILCSSLNDSSVKPLKFPCASRTMMTSIYLGWRLRIWMENCMFENMILRCFVLSTLGLFVTCLLFSNYVFYIILFVWNHYYICERRYQRLCQWSNGCLNRLLIWLTFTGFFSEHWIQSLTWLKQALIDVNNWATLSE